ncbi:MAG: ActS/PrrB/RegB family redox-sensitive histidine kinase [Candidatus Saccharibacteria bacterium]|nr:ActS/PrrB/RegB family redox-sensitive histidine kinase [Pseudorhodobacter sp.]
MFLTKGPQFPQAKNADFVPLRTLTNLRWMAIVGQTVALTVAPIYFDIDLPWGLCAAAVGISIIANVIFMTVFPSTKRLAENEALAMLLFDLVQLALLLTAAGGLTNPFALLVLAPVTISATALSLRSMVIVATAAILLVGITAVFGLPLQRFDGTVLEVPPLLRTGYLLSIVIGIVFLSLYSRRVATEIRTMSNALFAAQMALAREQKLTDLGGVVAATAHELGTPLATIKLVSSEMIDELQGQDSLLQDAMLIRDQADRCRDILRTMGRAGKDDLHLRQAPLSAVVQEAAEPHLHRGKLVIFGADGDDPKQPSILRRPEVIHGLRNLVQNAVDFADAKVWVDTAWTPEEITVRITDDGAGFPPQMIGRIGDPFVRVKPSAQTADLRKNYEGMGLGLFIAKTLLERIGAEMTFANAADPFLSHKERPERCGAVVLVRWPRSVIEAPADLVVGQNTTNPV